MNLITNTEIPAAAPQPAFRPRRCGVCGNADLRFGDVSAFCELSWHGFKGLKGNVPMHSWHCTSCGEILRQATDSWSYDAIAEEAVRAKIAAALREAAERTGMNARQMGALLGVTPEYLSMLASRKKTGSLLLWKALRLLADRPDGAQLLGAPCDRLDPNATT
jgi:hypothetical protein